MEDVICVTNRKLVKGDFLEQIKKVCQQHPKAIILREKDLSEDEYVVLANQVKNITEDYKVPLIWHTFYQKAMELGEKSIHLPLSILEQISSKEIEAFQTIGTSIHSLEEAKEAQSLGATYLTAGHIYETDCKKGLKGRGLSFLEEICKGQELPVYAIGGINLEAVKIAECKGAGAKGVCVMSGFMN